MNKELKMVEHLIKLTKNGVMEWYNSNHMSAEIVYGVRKIKDGDEFIIYLIIDKKTYRLMMADLWIDVTMIQGACGQLDVEIKENLSRQNAREYNNAINIAMNW